MSEAKFTKGPWIAQTHGGEVKHAVIYLNGGGFDISRCPDSVANAHLIAAAPEMYFLLEKLRAHYNFSEYCEKEIDDTLAKARGEL